MRPAYFIVAVPLAVLMGIASDQARSSDTPAAAPTAAATAKSSSSATYNTETTPLGTLLDNPAAKAILNKEIPSVVSGPDISQART